VRLAGPLGLVDLPSGTPYFASFVIVNLPVADNPTPPVQPPAALPDDTTPPVRAAGGVFAWLRRWLAAGRGSAWFASAATHAAIVLLLSWLFFPVPGLGRLDLLIGTLGPAIAEDVDLELSPLPAAGGELSASGNHSEAIAPQPYRTTVHVSAPESTVPSLDPLSTSTSSSGVESIGSPLASLGGGLEGRQAANRRRAALAGGGSDASEAAVELGLAWLAAHQYEDGGWRFDLKQAPRCQGECRDSGNGRSTTASTGLALLAFLGAGYTQNEGPYKQTVSDGLYYLIQQMVLTSMGGDLRDRSISKEQAGNVVIIQHGGSMYNHGIATLALCEAYAMTKDANLAQPAQEATKFIVNAQYENGGWRYEPFWEASTPTADTTVTGWQVTALKSAKLARLKVPREVWYKISDFLDTMQSDNGSRYGYTKPAKNRKTTSTVGLFCRMMLGWPASHKPLMKGVVRIADQLPHQNNMYFNYYASQVLHHFGGRGWKRFNPKMRNYLVGTQTLAGHERGSWYFDEKHSHHGGRLYTTTLAILTLEVYYRYMPMYQEAFVDDAP